MRKKRVLVVINPISGTNSKSNVPELIGKSYNDTDSEVFITYTKRANHAFELTREAVDMGFDTVIAVGGDGTINEVAKGLVGTNVSLGIVPCGSGNGLARTLGIPMSKNKAIKNLVQGDEVCIDTCRINSMPFFCTTGMGFDAEVSQRFAEASTRGPMTYAVNMVKEYINYKPQKYKITIDDESSFEKEAFVIAIANASQYGNDAYIAPTASLTDGLIDLIILEPFKSVHMPKVVYQLFTKKLDDNIHQTAIKAKKVVIERDSRGYVHIDGDPKEVAEKLEIEIVPKSLKVIIPNTSYLD